VGWNWNLKAKEEIHDLGAEVDELQHKLGDKVADIRLEVIEELHELGEELSALYQKIRRHF
jgi:phage host-nuclease inhibitor protein Gam